MFFFKKTLSCATLKTMNKIAIEMLREEFGISENVSVIHRKKLSRLDKLTLFVTERIGTIGFFFIVFVCFL